MARGGAAYRFYSLRCFIVRQIRGPEWCMGGGGGGGGIVMFGFRGVRVDCSIVIRDMYSGGMWDL